MQDFKDSEGIRLVRPEQMHCTVLFIGEVPSVEVEQIAGAISGIKIQSFPCTPCHPVAFPTANEPRVLALELVSDPVDRFLELHREAERCLTGFRVKRDRRRFRPHITLARCSEAVRDQVREWQNRALPPFQAEYLTTLTLYRSLTTHQGATYEEIAEHSLV